MRALRAPLSRLAEKRRRRFEPEPEDPRPDLLLGAAEYPSLRFAIDLVDRLAAEHGFDPAELVSARTHEPLGPLIDRIRGAVRSFEEASAEDAPGRDPYGSE